MHALDLLDHRPQLSAPFVFLRRSLRRLGLNCYSIQKDGKLVALCPRPCGQGLTADTDEKDAPETVRKRFSAESVISFGALPSDVLHDILKRELLRYASGIRERFGVEVVLDEQVFTALLLTKGGRADAAGVCALAKEFFFREVSGLLSLVGTPAMQGDMGDLDRLLIVVDRDGEAAQPQKLSETEERLSFRTERELPDDSKTARIRLIRQ